MYLSENQTKETISIFLFDARTLFLGVKIYGRSKVTLVLGIFALGVILRAIRLLNGAHLIRGILMGGANATPTNEG